MDAARGLLRFVAVAFCFALLVPTALAAPPSSCVCKFVGEWIYPGGSTTVLANGTAKPKCPFCFGVQSWTCIGNTYLFSNAGPPGQFTATLIAPDKMQYSGGSRRASAPEPARPAPGKRRRKAARAA